MAGRLIAVGEVMLDIASASIAPGEVAHAPIRVRPGGSPVTAARAAAAAGLDATVVGRVGADAAGHAVRAALADAGIALRLTIDAEHPTGTFLEVGTGAEQGIVADRGANAFLSEADVGELVADAVLLSGYVLLHDDTFDAGRAALEHAMADWIAVDAASARLATRIGGHTALARMLGANAIFADREEALALTGETEDDAAAALAEGFKLVCVKLRADGAIARVGGMVERRAPPRAPAPPGGR